MLIEFSDLGGLTLAYNAFLKSRSDPDTLDIPGIDGLTDRQRFFVAFAQAMRGNITDENLRNVTATEDHPWNKFRVNTIPYHLDAFYEAFPDINPGDSLYLNGLSGHGSGDMMRNFSILYEIAAMMMVIAILILRYLANPVQGTMINS